MINEKITRKVLGILKRGRENIMVIGYGVSTPCAEEIKPMVEKFFQKLEDVALKWITEGRNPVKRVILLEDMAEVLGANTRTYQKLSKKETLWLQKIFEESYQILEEVFYDTGNYAEGERLYDKVDCINNFLFNNVTLGFPDTRKENAENWQKEMIFKDYQNLWKAVHKLNSKWDDLWNRGRCKNIFSFSRDIRLKTYKQRSEEEKLEYLVQIVEGKMEIGVVFGYSYVWENLVMARREYIGNEIFINSFEKWREQPLYLKKIK